MRVTVKKWGNSAAVRIPAASMAATRLDVDAAVEVREERGRIIIEPVRNRTYDLRELVNGITAENRHDVVEFGAPLGREAW